MSYYQVVFLIIVGFILTYLERRLIWGYFQPTGYLTSKSITWGTYQLLPGQYRCLSSWIQYFIFRIDPITKGDVRIVKIRDADTVLHQGANWEKYNLFKFTLITSSLILFYYYIGSLGLDPMKGALIYSVLVAAVFYWDYNDCWLEMSFLSLLFLCLNGGYPLFVLAIITFLASLNRETAILHLPIVYLYTGELQATSFVALCFGMGQLVPRILYGMRVKRPTDLIKIRTPLRIIMKHYVGYLSMDNYPIRKVFLAPINPTIIYWVCLIAPFAILFPELNLNFKYLWCIFISFGLLISLPGDWSETRIYLPLLFVVVPLLLRLLG